MHMRDAVPQLSLFHQDPANDLARAALDLGWDFIQHRKHITEHGKMRIFSALAYVREVLASEARPR